MTGSISRVGEGRGLVVVSMLSVQGVLGVLVESEGKYNLASPIHH